jgi:type IV pilus assembly protein PilV
MRASPSRHRDAGFTLIEVMIAILLTAIAVVGIVGLYMVETRSSSVSRHATEASVLAEDQMEFLRTQPPTAGTGSDGPLAEPAGAAAMFSRNWTVTTQPNWVDYNVNVTWSEDGTSRNVQVYSRRAQ